MIIYDKVKVKTSNPKYETYGIKQGAIGRICSAEIRDNSFEVCFIDEKMVEDDIIIPINIQDLELVDKGFGNIQIIQQELPSDQPWWCIVEDGFIKNLKGDKKNKIAYDYDS